MLTVYIHLLVEKFIEAGRLPHLLLYGPPGMLALSSQLFPFPDGYARRDWQNLHCPRTRTEIIRATL